VPVLLAQFSVIAAASFRILPCLNRLVHSYSSFSFNLGPALNLMDTIGRANLLTPETRADGELLKPDGFGRTIEVQKLSFSYPSSREPVLSDLNLVIRRGERIGVLGASGSGKSTLIDILAGLYDPAGGAIFVDGRPGVQDTRRWQASIGYVPQTPFIMPGTIRENVVFGSNGHEKQDRDDEVQTILDEVGLAAFVASLPMQLDTAVGEKGTGLSGGQKQLLCMARALFRRPTLLLLDEPTSALDAINEKVVLHAIRNLSAETTIVMVSHKLENFRDFDTVYSCANGKLTLLPSDEFAPALSRHTRVPA
jgi:ABC-type multidrug transport system fused ATPase/permease subunit